MVGRLPAAIAGPKSALMVESGHLLDPWPRSGTVERPHAAPDLSQVLALDTAWAAPERRTAVPYMSIDPYGHECEPRTVVPRPDNGEAQYLSFDPRPLDLSS